MTIYVEKPAFNLRSKLNEVDFDKVPYQKMPSGSVVDISYASNATLSTHTNQHTTCVGPLTVNRKSRYNAIWLHTSVMFYHTNANGKFSFQVSFDDGTTWIDLMHFFAEDDPPWSNGYAARVTTGSFLYDASGSLYDCANPQFRTRFNHMAQNGGTLYLNRFKDGTANCEGACTLTAMEIRR